MREEPKKETLSEVDMNTNELIKQLSILEKLEISETEKAEMYELIIALQSGS